MTSPLCELLDAFVDGDLASEQADRFRMHLADCARCQDGLHSAMQLERLAHEARLGVVGDGSSADAGKVRSQGAMKRAEARWFQRRSLQAGAAVTASLAAAAMLIGQCREQGNGDGSAGPQWVAALQPTRAVEGRLAFAEAGAHRPYNVMRSGGGPAPVPLATLAALEKRGAHHEIASLYLAAGDIDRASQALDLVAPGPAVESDRAVIALARRQPAEAIVRLEAALEADAKHPAARWNRALALAELGLDLTAAAAFAELEADAGSGWAEEAGARAGKLRDAAKRRQASVEQALAAGSAMIEHGTPMDSGVLRAHPDYARRAFYDAVRVASDDAAIDRLASVALAIDEIAGGQRMRDRLEAAKAKRKALGERRRGPAAAYREFVLGKRAVAPAEVSAFLGQMRASGDPDLLLAALYALGPVPARETSELVALATADGDPWFRLVAAGELATLQRNSGQQLDAEATLLAVEAVCANADASLALRCTLRDHFLAEGYASENRLEEARVRAGAQRRRIQSRGDWLQEGAVLPVEAQIALLDGGYALAKAILAEVEARRPGECAVERFSHLALAQAAQNEQRATQARTELTASPLCDEPISSAALHVEADLARFERDPARVAAVRAELRQLRTTVTDAGERARLDFFEGRLLSTTDAPTAQGLLRKAIEAMDQNPTHVDSAKVRGYAFSTLAVIASASGDHSRALQLLAEETRINAPPRQCALGLAVDDERVVVAVLDSNGNADGAFTAARSPGPIDPDSVVPAQLGQRLRACAEVSVFARPPLQGRAGLLPTGVAYSFRGGVAAKASAPARDGRRVVIVADDPPPGLGLPRLAGAGVPRPGELRIEGGGATPDGALAAMQGASELIIHAHGRVDLALSSASHLVLSLDSAGRFALTADAIARLSLRSAPTVVLAACHAAHPGGQLHEPWSLPAAFLRAGARAVFASLQPIPDQDSAGFFDAVLDEVRGGAPAAIALETVRSRYRSAGSASAWFESVVVFE